MLGAEEFLYALLDTFLRYIGSDDDFTADDLELETHRQPGFRSQFIIEAYKGVINRPQNFLSIAGFHLAQIRLEGARQLAEDNLQSIECCLQAHLVWCHSLRLIVAAPRLEQLIEAFLR